MIFCFYNPSVTASRDTSAYYRPIVTKRSTNKIARTPFVFAVGKTCFMEGTTSGDFLYRIKQFAEGFDGIVEGFAVGGKAMVVENPVGILV